MSRLRPLVGVFVYAAFAVSALGVIAALHLPAPSGVADTGAQRRIRGVWGAAGAAGESAQSVIPDAVAPLLDDKALHFGLFLWLASLWGAGRALGRGLSARTACTMFVILATCAGVGELVQTSQGRVADLMDWLANVAGSAFGLAGVMVVAAPIRRARRV